MIAEALTSIKRVLLPQRHCEERSDEAIHLSACGGMDCFASLAMTAISIGDMP